MEAAIDTIQAAHNEDEYEQFLGMIQTCFAMTISRDSHLFTTDTVNLFRVFLEALPLEMRQHYTCNACRHFVDRFGGLVSLSPDGQTTPVMWPLNVPEPYRNSVDAVRRVVSKARVTGVFFSKDMVWGQPVTGPWHHMAVIPSVVWQHPIQTPFQTMAEKKEDFKTLINGLMEFPLAAVDEAIKLLKTDSLYRSEKVLGVAEWFRDLHEKRKATMNNYMRANLTWLAVASAPAGFCHIKSSMIGTLLEDIVVGLPFGSISKRFADKMHPLQYQRPQAPPSAGNIAQAEKIVEQLGIKDSLRRRFARFDEIQTIWKPTEKQPEKEGTGVFSHLKTKDEFRPVQGVEGPTVTMTWEKFARTVLPEAEQIEFYIHSMSDSYAALVTAVNPDAPPVLQWDHAERRNPVSWYTYHGGSIPSRWGLESSSWHKVNGICVSPFLWGNPETVAYSHLPHIAFFILHGAKDSRIPGAALFPELLRSELHSIRSTIEAYSKEAKMEGADEASACGLMLSKGNKWNARFSVTSKGARIEYKLDRWD
jgi:hypothetical protein